MLLFIKIQDAILVHTSQDIPVEPADAIGRRTPEPKETIHQQTSSTQFKALCWHHAIRCPQLWGLLSAAAANPIVGVRKSVESALHSTVQHFAFFFGCVFFLACSAVFASRLWSCLIVKSIYQKKRESFFLHVHPSRLQTFIGQTLAPSELQMPCSLIFVQITSSIGSATRNSKQEREKKRIFRFSSGCVFHETCLLLKVHGANPKNKKIALFGSDFSSCSQRA